MTEWELIKKEYREIPIPADGPHQMLKVVADAKRKRDRWKRVVKYSSVVAAALLVVILLPGMVFFSGGFGGSEDMAATESAVSKEESIGSDGWFAMDSAEDAAENDSVNADYGMCDGSISAENKADSLLAPSVEQGSLEQSIGNKLQEEKKLSFPVDAVSKEILRQMEARMQENGETYYIKSELYPEGFEIIAEEQEYYVNEEGLYVIVFEAGTVAPEAMGVIEFIIPAEVAVP